MGEHVNKNFEKLDYLIVGQGIAGSLIAYLLLKLHRKILVIDNNHTGAASTVAAGIINPVTGKSFVKSWRIDELLPHAISMYQSIEKDYGIKIIRNKNIIRTLETPTQENLWLSKTADPEYVKYCLNEPDVSELIGKIRPSQSYAEITSGCQINITRILQAVKSNLMDESAYLSENFDHSLLESKNNGFGYKKYFAKKIIFCEGYKGEQNPFFQGLAFSPSKGEALIVRIPNADFKKLYKGKFFIAHLYEDVYWVGSGYEWRPENDLPSDRKLYELTNYLHEMLLIPFEVLDHQAAIRPGTKNRRPIVLQHPLHKTMYMFNGLGTKGSSLCPYFAKNLVEHLEDGTKLDL